MASDTKRCCRKCLVFQPWSEFWLETRRADKHQFWCKTCTREYRAERSPKKPVVRTGLTRKEYHRRYYASLSPEKRRAYAAAKAHAAKNRNPINAPATPPSSP